MISESLRPHRYGVSNNGGQKLNSFLNLKFQISI